MPKESTALHYLKQYYRFLLDFSLVSYDGRTGEKTHGERLPDDLNLTLIELYAGRSTQATLLGRDDVTIESLYLSPRLADELAHEPIVYRYTRGEQLCLLEGRPK